MKTRVLARIVSTALFLARGKHIEWQVQERHARLSVKGEAEQVANRSVRP
jgi:hypothetical protein